MKSFYQKGLRSIVGKQKKTNLIHEERIQYVFDEDKEGISRYVQKYIFELDDSTDEFEIKLVNIDDVDKDYDQADGKVFTFCIKDQ